MVNCIECGEELELDNDSVDGTVGDESLVIGGRCHSCKKVYHVYYTLDDVIEIDPKKSTEKTEEYPPTSIGAIANRLDEAKGKTFKYDPKTEKYQVSTHKQS